MKIIKCNVILLHIMTFYNLITKEIDDFWGSGLNIAGTKHINKTAWPGKNMLVDIITKLSKNKKIKTPV